MPGPRNYARHTFSASERRRDDGWSSAGNGPPGKVAQSTPSHRGGGSRSRGLAVACKTKSGATGTAGRGAGTGASGRQPQRGGAVNYAGGLLGSFDLAGRTWDPHVQTQSGVRSLRLFYDTLLAYDLVSYEVQQEDPGLRAGNPLSQRARVLVGLVAAVGPEPRSW
jgi:hypothetical protein